MKNNTDGTLSFDICDISVANALNLYNTKTGDIKEILSRIVKYIEDNGDICMKEK